MKDFEALIFDFGNVLIDLDIDGWRAGLARHVDPTLDTDLVKDQLKALFHQIEKGLIEPDDFITSLSSYLPGLSPSQLIDLWNAILVGIPSSIFDLLLQLRDRYNVYLLSNTNAIHLDWVYRHLRLQHQVVDWDVRYFDQTFYSHVLRKRKPDEDIFKEVIDKADLSTSRTLFFDDDVDNIRAAMDFGLQAYLKPPQRPIGQIISDLGLL